MTPAIQPETAPPSHLDLDRPFPAEWHAALTELAVLAVAEVHGCVCAAITMTNHGVPFTATSTSAQARAVDQAQYRPSDGPCLIALRSDQVVSCEDYTTESRWPGIAREALAAGVRSSLSLPLHNGTDVVGSLNLYGTVPAAFDVPAQRDARALARHSNLTLQYADRLHRERVAHDVEHRLAETMQGDLLPQPAPQGIVCAARYLPSGHAGQVGGDWYDLFTLPDDALGVAVGDVMGHDVADAAAAGVLRSVLRSYAYTANSPCTVLDQLDRLVQGLDLTPLATAFYGRLVADEHGALLRYSNAGHLPPLLRAPDGSVSWLTGAASHLIGAPLSGLPARTQATVRLPIGSTLLLYTDGLVEGRVDGRRPDLDEGRARLSRLVAALPDTGPEALCDRVIDGLVGDQHDDDIVLFAVQITRPAGVAPLTDQGSKPEHEDLVRTADRVLRLAHLLASAEQQSKQLWQDLLQHPSSPYLPPAAARSAWCCYALVQDALLAGVVELAAVLNVPDHLLPG